MGWVTWATLGHDNPYRLGILGLSIHSTLWAFLQKWEEARPGLLERTIMICWGIWKNRNEARHGGKQRSGLAVWGRFISALNNAIHGLNEIDPSVQNVVRGILQCIQGFRTFAFSHTKRQANAQAHALAQQAVNVEDFLVFK